jgi:hypothetical protein
MFDDKFPKRIQDNEQILIQKKKKILGKRNRKFIQLNSNLNCFTDSQ